MSRVLILGGYGVFGGRLARLLLADGHDVTVAGRSIDKARRFCRRWGGRPLALDRFGPLDAFEGVEVVVDASGPFQATGDDPYRAARAALSAGAHYLDLSDDAGFTTGIAALDEEAKAVGRVALSGVSSVPALSAAAVHALAEGLDRIDLIESAILPGNRAPRGRAVMGSILAQAGEPMVLYRDGRTETATGWSDPAPFTLAPGLTRRARLIGAPDLSLFPRAFDARTVLFRAGLELWPLRAGLAALSAGRARGLLPRLTRFLPILQPLAALFAPFGSDRGGMVVRVVGPRAGKIVERRWHLLAERGEGPFVPAIPARALIPRLDALPPGARPCLAELTLDAAEAALADREITCTRQSERPARLFATVADLELEALPPPVRDLHAVHDRRIFTGRARVERGRAPLARLAAWLFRFPSAGHDSRVSVRMQRDGDGERWERSFDGNRFRSHLRVSDGRMTERFGPFTFTLGLHIADGALHFPVTAGRIGPVPIPRALLPRSTAREYLDGQRAAFDVALDLPLGLGRVVRYRGWLDPMDEALALDAQDR
ncbi:DUF4166 domain-containing protein [Roseobacter sp. HKCCA0434]|uniref:DUF4166 domain-containing protein n=1 Tax=Roseobacter sp. HKCCA0434 TaxID=3079297 RepID=UPI002905E0BB|nr:DUF4166 domain-containing protein [Roseobacter sp. HKCCA0434]